MADSVFTKIIKGEIPTSKVYEDDESLAIMDINPVNHGHVLVFPKIDYSNVYEIPAELFMHLMKVVHMLAPAVKAATGAEGINIFMNNEPAAGQVITPTTPTSTSFRALPMTVSRIGQVGKSTQKAKKKPSLLKCARLSRHEPRTQNGRSRCKRRKASRA
jgi:hypothetical protein